jgi:hypothetical protein
MSRFEEALRTALFAGGVVFLVGALASSSEGFQRPPPAKDGGLVEAHEGCLGHGKGEVILPQVGEEGRMSGFLLDCEGVRWFRLEALMTGYMPDAAVGTPGYEFGGLYGKIWQLGGAPEPWTGAAASFGIEGTWQLFEEGQGTFKADVLQFTDSGRMDAVGNIYGKFAVHPERPLGATLVFGDAQVPTKATKSRFRDAAGQPVDEPYGDAASVPRKVYPKTPYSEARNKTVEPSPWGDAASVPRKVYPKTPFGDAATATPEPSPWGDALSAPRKTYPKTPYSEARNKTVEPNPWGDAASVPRKVYPKTPFGDAATATPEPSPWGDALSVPRKAYPKTPYGEARNKTIEPSPWGDAASVPRKVYPKTPFRDATTGPQPVEVGVFYLRFRFDG